MHSGGSFRGIGSKISNEPGADVFASHFTIIVWFVLCRATGSTYVLEV
jgi:hypothetical protein